MSYNAAMGRPYSTLNRLSRIAEDQWGLVTRRQAELAGVSPATLQRVASEGVLERVAHGVYHLSGAPIPDHLELRAAWLQLAPEVVAWERTPRQGVVSHRSAAALYGLGHLPADRHDFTVPARRQSRRSDVRIHQRPLAPGATTWIRGLPAKRPSQIASDLLADREDAAAVANVVADALRAALDDPASFAEALAPHAARVAFRRGDGLAVLRWLLDLVGDPDAATWMQAAQAHVLGAHGPNTAASAPGMVRGTATD